jgi:hypothetical protein
VEILVTKASVVEAEVKTIAREKTKDQESALVMEFAHKQGQEIKHLKEEFWNLNLMVNELMCLHSISHSRFLSIGSSTDKEWELVQQCLPDKNNGNGGQKFVNTDFMLC